MAQVVNLFRSYKLWTDLRTRLQSNNPSNNITKGNDTLDQKSHSKILIRPLYP